VKWVFAQLMLAKNYAQAELRKKRAAGLALS
jgi:hypothetical protein